MCKDGKAIKIMMKLEDPEGTIKIIREHENNDKNNDRKLNIETIFAPCDDLALERNKKK